MTAHRTTPSLGFYVRPQGASDSPENIDAREGTVYAIERTTSAATGEIVDLLHVVHVNNGQLRFGMLTGDHVDTADPPSLADLDSLVKLAGRQFLKTGRRTEDRYFTLMHVCAAVLAQPSSLPEMPSVFGDLDDHHRPVCGDCGRPLNDGLCPKHDRQPHQAGITADIDMQVAALLARLDAVSTVERNEVRRTARQQGWTYLEAGAQLKLGDLLAYDAALRRWEKAAAARAAGERTQVAS